MANGASEKIQYQGGERLSFSNKSVHNGLFETKFYSQFWKYEQIPV